MADTRRHKAAEWLEPPVEEVGLRRYAEILREGLWIIVLAVFVTTAAAIAYVALAPRTYEGTADLLISPVAQDTLPSLPLIRSSADPTRDVETASRFVTNLAVAERVRTDTDSSASAKDLLAKVNAVPVAQSNFVAVTASAGSGHGAAELANAFADASVEIRTEALHKAIDDQLPAISAQSAQSPSDTTAGSQLSQFEALQKAPDPTFSVQSPAAVPDSPASPRPVLSIVGGILAGLILGICGAFAAQALDPRLRREQQLRRRYRLPILARIPKMTGRSGRSPLGPRAVSAAIAEAYRTLRSTLQAEPHGSRAILVTGPSASEGKTTTALNLASSLAAAGSSVILMEADLRRPAIGETIGLEEQPPSGIVNVLIENASLEESLVTTKTYGPNLRFLLADFSGGWIAELFSIPAAQRIVDDARELADYVIVDSPPLNEVVDALPLARKVDGVLIVVRLGRSRLDKISRLGELLAENDIVPVGFAVVGTPRPDRSAYNYQGSDGEPARRLFKSTARSG